MADISSLLEIMARLRDPQNGCPWDLAQSYRSIVPHTLEEAFEVADAIESGALDDLPDELGDLLFQIVFYARIAEEEGRFAFGDVVERICRKMIRRHPHVFAAASVDTAAEQSRQWEQIKQQEHPARDRVLSGIPMVLPALTRAAKIGRRAASVGFDWPSEAPVRAKIEEELAEVDQAIVAGSQEETEAELGDLLFAVVNLCRHRSVDPEQALRGANDRFSRRFADVEASVNEAGGDWQQFDLDQLEAFWRAAKARER